MNQIEHIEYNVEKIIGLLEQFKKASKSLKEKEFYRDWDKNFFSMKITNEVLEIIRKLSERYFPLLGIRDYKSNYNSGYSFNFINGIMSLGQVGALWNEDEYGFYITLDKNFNNAEKPSKINFCMNNEERKKSIKNIKNCLIDFNEVDIIKYGDYTLKIIVKNKQIECATLAKIVEIIISNLINDNDNGSDNEYLKYINKLLVENI